MATRKNGKTKVEPTHSEETEMNETSMLPDQLTGVEIICNDCDDLNVDELKQVINYCSSRIDELQKEQVSLLEEQMRAIQEKLMALKGHKGHKAAGNGKRVATPLVNPDNPKEIYTFGKLPDWVVKLMEKTGKTVRELKAEMAKGTM